ncbi:hypothetical protein QZH41_000341 [Actinostola sp. cb2023]|nr:hypothetical protein QZH41_000341 [Actinostola sp. cb2023]
MHKKGSPERGKVWKTISEKLNGNATHRFEVDHRGVRDHYMLLKKKYKKKISDEIKASGIAPKDTELDRIVAEVIDMEESSTSFEQADSQGKKKSDADERKKAEDIRHKAMETLAETKKRRASTASTEEDDEDEDVKLPAKKRFRRNGNETISFLKMKNEVEVELRKEEIALQKELELFILRVSKNKIVRSIKIIKQAKLSIVDMIVIIFHK